MTAITDKFGKGSISTGYATATTVKTARVAGDPVLPTFDLSKFALDTPVFLVTYKKTTDPVTGVVSVTSQTSWKALVNPDNNTLTNLTLAPGYTDIGNEVGDFVECIPTSYWVNSLIDGLFVSINPDGTLKTSAVNAALGLTGVTPQDWTVLPVVPTVLSSAGQKEHVLRFAGIDLRPTLQETTKLRIPRTGTTPTQSMAFVSASNQYAVKATPVAMAQTDDITFETILTLDSYPSGGQNLAGQRSAGTNGWRVLIEPDGRISMYGYNGANYKGFQSFPVIPLKKPTHIAVQLDVSGYTTATCKLWIDGVDVPIGFASSGAMTAWVNAGSFALGSDPSALGSFTLNGKMAGTRLWSTLRTPAQIKDNIGKKLVGNETGLVYASKDDGTFNDLTANGNNLTATNGAIATFAGHPFSAIEYAVVLAKPVYDAVNNRTDVTIFTGSGFLPNDVLGTVSYSGLRSPYGFPSEKSKWTLETRTHIDTGITSPVAATGYYANTMLAIPTGRFSLKLEATTSSQRSGGGDTESIPCISATPNTTTPLDGDNRFRKWLYASTSANGWYITGVNIIAPVVNAAQRNVYLNTSSGQPALNIYFRGGSYPTILTAEYEGL